MIRHTQFGPSDAEVAADGDAAFAGVNAKLQDSVLATEAEGMGLCRDAVNKRFLDGSAATRGGSAMPVQFNDDFLPTPRHWKTYLGAGVFSDPNGVEWMLIAQQDKVWQCRDGSAPRGIDLPAGTVLGEVDLLQAFSKVVMLRGTELDPMEWDGSVPGAFKVVDQSVFEAGDGTSPIPKSDLGEVHSSRLWVKTSRDTLAASDLLDYTRFDLVNNVFRFNTGEDDAIVAVTSFRRTNLVVFKDQSIHLLAGATGDLSSLAAEVVNTEVGCVARRSVAAVGGDLFFLGAGGVYRVSEVVENSMQAQEVPVSDGIQRIIDRINWRFASGAAAGVFGRYYRLAVPIDGSEFNNAVLVYDTVSRQWQGYDEWDSSIVPSVSNQIRIYFQDPDDSSTFPGWTNADYEGLYFDLPEDNGNLVRFWFNYTGSASEPDKPQGGRNVEVDISVLDLDDAWENAIDSDGGWFNSQKFGSFIDVYFSAPTGTFRQPAHPGTSGFFWTWKFLPRRRPAIDRFLKTDFLGEKRLFGLDYASVRTILLDWGRADELDGSSYAVVDRVDSRGYLFGELGGKQVLDLEVFFESIEPDITISTIGDGVAEIDALKSGLTRDPEKYMIHGRTDYDLTNVNDDHESAGREDYVVKTGHNAVAGSNGLKTNLRQAWRWAGRVRHPGRSLGIRVANASGALAVRSIQVAARRRGNKRRIEKD